MGAVPNLYLLVPSSAENGETCGLYEGFGIVKGMGDGFTTVFTVRGGLGLKGFGGLYIIPTYTPPARSYARISSSSASIHRAPFSARARGSG